MKHHLLTPRTTQGISSIFSQLDFQTLGHIYCDEGGDAFWKDRRKPCQQLGTNLAKALKSRLSKGGRSLYVGAGVAEIPPLLMETLDLAREVLPYNLRSTEVLVLNQACQKAGLTFFSNPAETAEGDFDHLWLVSVLNDPERFPELSALSYNRADPIHFDPIAFEKERQIVRDLLLACMQKLRKPALVTTTIEEQPWIIHWCHSREIPFRVETKTYPTALVGDPICFIWVGTEELPVPPSPLNKKQRGNQK